MTSQNRSDERIPRLLLELSDDEVIDSDSDVDDDLTEDFHGDVEDVPKLVSPWIPYPNVINVSVKHEASAVPIHNFMIDSKGLTLGSQNDQRWTATKEGASDTSATNIVRGPTETTRNLIDPLECFNTFINDDILEEITQWTNEEIELKMRADTKATFKPTTAEEIRAVIGILALTAALKDNHLTTDELFDCTYSGSRYIAAMCRDRFDFLIRNMRMYDRTLRADPTNTDAFLPFRKIWEIFTNQCRVSYSPGPCVTVAERYLAYRGRCPFRIYEPNKPRKCGIKIVTACDSTTRYMIDATPYLGRCTETNGLQLEEFLLIELTKSIHGTNRNVTCDGCFTSVSMAKRLLEHPYNLTLVGAIRSDRPDIPEALRTIRTKDVGTSLYCYDGPVTLMSYRQQQNKTVYFLSSYDEQNIFVPSESVPNIVRFYNETKGAVDTFDRICASMSCSRKSKRWPTTVFYGILDMAFVNSYVIHCHNAAAKGDKPMNRRDFMKALSNALMSPWIARRQEIPNLSSSLKGIMSSVALKRPADGLREGKAVERKRTYCAYCPPRLRRMTKTVCDKCSLPICGEHKTTSCVKCFEYE